MKRIWRDDSGQDLIEYALMAGLSVLTAGAMFPVMLQTHDFMHQVYTVILNALHLAAG